MFAKIREFQIFLRLAELFPQQVHDFPYSGSIDQRLQILPVFRECKQVVQDPQMFFIIFSALSFRPGRESPAGTGSGQHLYD